MGHSGRRGRDEKLESLARQGWAAGRGEDQRWLASSSDEVRAAPGTVVARQASPARWIYVVVTGEVRWGDVAVGPGHCISPADGDVIAEHDALLLAVPARQEAELRQRFPGLDRAPAPVAAAPVCPVHALVARTLRRQPVSMPR